MDGEDGVRAGGGVVEFGARDGAETHDLTVEFVELGNALDGHMAEVWDEHLAVRGLSDGQVAPANVSCGGRAALD